MRIIRSALIVYISSLPSLALAIPPPPAPRPANPPNGMKGMAPSASSTTTTTKSVSTVFSSVLSFQTSTAVPPITVQTIVDSSSMSSSDVFSPTYVITSSLASSSSSAGLSTGLINSAQQMSSTSLATSNGTSDSDNRRLIIILACVLGFLGLLLIAGIIALALRYRRRQAPFGPRGASPIDDEEIASWRRSEQEKRQQDRPSEHRAAIREVPELSLEHHSGWTWATTASSGSIHTIPCSLPNSPSYVAPNARAGLTDETKPGADPFITPSKRHNSRLSKLPPNHSRTRSGRSSFSAKSMIGSQGHNRTSSDQQDRSPTWYYNYGDDSGSHAAYLKETEGTDSPRISTFDEWKSGGLSPRPQTGRTKGWDRIDDIGRAIA